MAPSPSKGTVWAVPLLGGCVAAVALLIVVQGISGVAAPVPSSGPPARAASARGLGPDLGAAPFPPAVVATVGVGSLPVAGVFDPANGYVYVTNSGSDSNSVSVVRGTTVVATVSLAANQSGTPLYLVYDSGNGFVYVVARYDGELPGLGEVNVLNGTSVVASVIVGSLPDFAVLDPLNGYLYVPDSGGSNVTVVSGERAIASVPVGSGPCAAAFDPLDGYVYVANGGSANVSMLFGTHLVGSLPAGEDPASVAYDPIDGDVYVANAGSNNVSLYSDVSVAGNASVGLAPSFLAFNPSVGGVEVANTGSNNLSVLNGSTVVASRATAAGPVWLGSGPFQNLTFVVDEDANAVTVLQGVVPVGNVTVGAVPVFAVADPLDQFEYVLDSGGDNLSVLATTYLVTFNETGLAAGVGWSVTLAGATNTSTTSAISFVEPNGQYPYAIGTPAGYRLVSPSPGSVVQVDNGSAVVPVVFAVLPTESYNLTFVETGLSNGCSGGRGGWEPAPRVDCCRSSPLSWGVTVDGVTKTTTNTSVTFSERDGTYNYTVLPPSGYSATSFPSSPVTIDGANLTVNVTFSRTCGSRLAAITFEESGLPWATTWCVTLNGTLCSTGREIVFSGLAPGSYAFNVTAVPGYSARPASGSVTLTSRSVTVEIQFSGKGHSCGG